MLYIIEQLLYRLKETNMLVAPYPWKTMSDEAISEVIRSEGTELIPAQVTPEYIQGMRHYREVYGYHAALLSFMVRIDMARGVNVCTCSEMQSDKALTVAG